jgi:hypothetical protein
MASLSDFKKLNSNNTNKALKKDKSLSGKIKNFASKDYVKEYDPNQNAFSQAISNLDDSGKQYVKDIITPFLNPIQTAKDIGALGSSVVNLLVPGEQGNEDLARQVGQFFKERYGGIENIKKTFATDPVGLLGDVSILFTGGSALAGKVAGKTSTLAKALRVAENIDPLVASSNAIKGAGKLGQAITSNTLGLTTGAGKDAISTAYEIGQGTNKRVQKSFQDNLRGKEDITNVVDEAKSSLLDKKKSIQEEYLKGKDALNLEKTFIPFDEVETTINNALSDYSDFGISNLDKAGKTKLKEIQTLLKEYKKTSNSHNAFGMDALKKAIDNLYPTGINVGVSGRLVSDIRNAVKNTIVKKNPEYSKVMKSYEEAMGLYRQMSDELSLNNRAKVGTILKKLQSVLRNNVNTNFGSRLDALKYFDTEDGNLMAKLAGQSLNTFTPRGIQSLVPTGVLAGGAVYGGGAISPMSLAPLSLGSPRLMGEASYYAGKMSKPFVATNKFMDKYNVSPTGVLRGSRAVGLLDQPIQEYKNEGLLQ